MIGLHCCDIFATLAVSLACYSRIVGGRDVLTNVSSNAEHSVDNDFGFTPEVQRLRGSDRDPSLSKTGTKPNVQTPLGVDDRRRQFDDFKANFGRSYDSRSEGEARFRVFVDAIAVVEQLNELNGKAIFGISHYSDFLQDELNAVMATGLILGDFDSKPKLKLSHVGRVEETQRGTLANTSMSVPPEIDWRRTVAVTPVKSQGSCGSCWAFSVAEEVESMYAIHVDDRGSQIFSTQQIASCAPEADGCGGGNPVYGYKYLMDNATGLAQEVFWPFAGGLTPQDQCAGKDCTQSCDTKDLDFIFKYEVLMGPYAKVFDAFFAVPPCIDVGCEKQDLTQLAFVIANVGPVAAAVNAKNWYYYKGGVMTYAACGNSTMSDMDHAVQVVGFNTGAPVPYWIVRNTWSTIWGEYGYIYLEYAKNTCGIANLATYPEVVPRHHDNSSRKLQQERTDRFMRLYRQAIGEVADKDAVREDEHV